jgi:hypothetical protein
MANFYKNAFYDPTVTTAVAVYTCPANANAIIQNIQLTNTGGSKTVQSYIIDASATTTYQIAYAAVSGPTICNLAKGPIVLEESDILLLETSDTSGISAAISILEINRNNENGRI